MNNFVVRILLIFALALGFALLLEQSISYTILNYRTRNKVNVSNRIDVLESEVLVLGSSRAWHNIIPSVLRDSLKMSVYNLAYDDFGPMEVLTQIKYLVSEGANPELILVQIDESYNNGKKSVIAMQEFLPLYSYVHPKAELEDYFAGFPDHSYYKIPLYRYTKYRDISWRGMIKLPFLYNQGLAANGYKPYPVGSFVDSRDNREMYQIVPENVNLSYKSLQIFCKNMDVELIFFTSPLYNLKDARLLEYFDKNYEPYFDQSALLEKDIFFKDIVHVNHKGAIIQSADLAHRIKSYTSSKE